MNDNNESSSNRKRNPFQTFSYFSFVPALGFVIAFFAILLGILTIRRGGLEVIKWSFFGVLFNVVIYGSLFYFGFVQRDGIYDDLRAQMSATNINELVRAIEFHKLQNGEYPANLDILESSLDENSLVFTHDSSHVAFTSEPRKYHYELVDPDNYYLLGVGRDGVPYTSDDIVPSIQVPGESNIGLLIKSHSTDY